MKALIDGDIFRYKCGFAAESTHYIVHRGDRKYPFDYKREALEFVKGWDEGTYEIEKYVTVDPVSHALGNVKQLLAKVLEATQATEYQFYLTGKGNYREKVAQTKPYKGNRDSLHKPKHFDAITDYLINKHNAIVIEGAEADDAMGYGQTEDTCICSTDKDLNMIPGLHYNWDKDIFYKVSLNDADLWFYCQLLMGDQVDNIQGIPKMGKIKTFKALKDTETVEEMYTSVLQAYEKAELESTLIEMADLLWIQREEGVLWSPPGGTKRLVEENLSES